MTPPTDSLYKFIAIAGLLVLAWGVAYPWNKWMEYELKVVETKAEIRKATQKLGSLNTLYSAVKEEGKKLANEPESLDRETRSKAIELRKQTLYVEMLEALQPVDTRADVLEVMEHALHSYKLMGLVSIVAGLLLTTVGFSLWYKRVQRHIDAELQHHNSGKVT